MSIKRRSVLKGMLATGASIAAGALPPGLALDGAFGIEGTAVGAHAVELGPGPAIVELVNYGEDDHDLALRRDLIRIDSTNYGDGIKANEFLFQLNFAIGAHGAHVF